MCLFLEDQDFFQVLPNLFHLPVYAEALSRDFVAMDPNPTSRARSVQPRVLEFIDDYANLMTYN